MGLFWIVAGLLVIAALLFVLPALLGRRDHLGPARDQINRALHRQRVAELERDVNDDILTRSQYERARLDLERQLLAESADDTDPIERPSRKQTPWVAWVVGIALPALAVGLYVQLNTGFESLNGEAGRAALATGEGKAPSMDEMVAAI